MSPLVGIFKDVHIKIMTSQTEPAQGPRAALQPHTPRGAWVLVQDMGSGENAPTQMGERKHNPYRYKTEAPEHHERTHGCPAPCPSQGTR